MRQHRGLLLTIILLTVAVVVLAWLNMDSLTVRDQELDNPELVIRAGGEVVGTIDLNRMQALGAEEFDITLRSSGQAPRNHTLTGVPLAAIIDDVAPGRADAARQLVARAIDGYVVAFDAGELREPDHLYVVYLQDGAGLGSKADGGSGPLMLVPRQDEFGQRWCKFLVEVSLE